MSSSNNSTGTDGDSDDTSTDAGPGRREVAYRLFAAEFDDCSLSYSESDEERAPNYVVTPTGLRVNRLFAVGVVTEVERINNDTLRGRIVDPTGAFVTYAGQYQPEAQAFLDSTTPPAFMAITGKARTFEPADADRVFTSVRPESLSEVDADSRDRWVVSAAEATLRRIAIVAEALDSGLAGDDLRAALEAAAVGPSLAAGIPRALEHYGTTTAYLEAMRQLAVDTLELVAGEREEVRSIDIAPDAGGETTLGPLPAVDIDLSSADREPSESPPQPEDEPTDVPETGSTAPSTPDETVASADPEPAKSTVTTDAEPDAAAPDSDAESPEPASETTAESIAESQSVEASEPVDSTTAEAEPEELKPAQSEPAASDSTEADPVESDSTEADPVESDSAEADPVESDSAEAESTAAESPEADPEASGMYQLDDEEREELEAEFGSDFSSGNDIDPAGEADIDVPDVDELAAQKASEQAAESPGADPADSPPTAQTTQSATETTSEKELGSFEDDIGSFEETPTDEPETPADADETVAAEDDTSADSVEPEDPETAADSVEPEDSETPAEEINLENVAVELMAELDDGDGADREDLVSTVVDSHGVEADAVEDAIDDALMSGRCYEPDAGVLKSI